MVEFKPIQFKSSSQLDENDPLYKILVDNNLDSKKINSKVTFNSWSSIGSLISLFKFDSDMHEQVNQLLYPKISTLAVEYMEDNLKGTS